MKRSNELSRVLSHLSHGETVEPGDLVRVNAPAAAATNGHRSSVQTDLVTVDTPAPAADLGTTPFDYLFTDLVDDPDAHLPTDDPAAVVDALNRLGNAMIEQDSLITSLQSNSPIPPIYTYWGQFIDHDLTANTDRDKVLSIEQPDPLLPLPPHDVTSTLLNLRNPALNLDTVYGDGPFEPADDDEVVPYDGIKLRVGALTKSAVGGSLIPPVDDRFRDLPRVGPADDTDPKAARALIGDARNDENLVIAQIQVAFLRFHNAAVDWVRRNEPERTGDGEVFLRARDLTRWTYQWLVVHDYLPTVTEAGTVDRVLVDEDDLLDLAGRGTYMPLEFSVAAFRFGHSMVRAAYDWNRNFGLPGSGLPNASFRLLFTFTGKATNPFLGARTLPDNWPAEWSRMIDKNSQVPERFARRIDTHLSPPLGALTNEGLDPSVGQQVQTLLKQLARRNLLRGWLLSLPTGQAVAAQLGAPPLTATELTQTAADDPSGIAQILTESGFVDRTPLWFYVLKEAEVRNQGASLGTVGSHIVASTIIGQIRHDPTSYLHQASWSPEAGVRLPDGSTVSSIGDFFRFAGVFS
jgi:hypothetical protein